jgi:hypothetical protein
MMAELAQELIDEIIDEVADAEDMLLGSPHAPCACTMSTIRKYNTYTHNA